MTELTILPVGAEHLSALAELERLCFSEPWSEQGLALLLAEGSLGVVLLRNGQAVAYGGMTTVLDEGAVTNIATHPEHRREGLGRQVLRWLLAEAAGRGVAQVFLEVRESNTAAKNLYASEGFVPCGLRKGFYRHPTENAIQMVWKKNEDEGL
ncbi:MAG: ribosomal protein S18-alanine N-acetyltransferase [Clostridia bacterium]|nr:ribosomal protein S18-alanine N-acetyltransferase [Clostridia bacterium]